MGILHLTFIKKKGVECLLKLTLFEPAKGRRPFLQVIVDPNNINYRQIKMRL